VCWVCPYEAKLLHEVCHFSKALFDMGCYEVYLGFTIGTENTAKTQHYWDAVYPYFQQDKIAVHFSFDTFGQAFGQLYMVRLAIRNQCL